MLRTPCLIAATALAAVALPASAASAAWTPVTDPHGRNIDQVDTARTPDGRLHVLWALDPDGAPVGSASLHDSVLSPSGKLLAEHTVAAGQVGITNPGVTVLPGGVLEVAWGGQVSGVEGVYTQRSATGGATWTPPAPSLAGDSAEAADGVDAASLGGTPFQAFAGTIAGAFVHRGDAPAAPAGEFHDSAFGAGCCAGHAGLAANATTGSALLAWTSNANGHLGVHVRGVNPATGQPSGGAQRMPGVLGTFAGKPGFDDELSRVPVVARTGRPGFFVAYPGGYPSYRRIVLWRVGTATPFSVATSKRSPGNATVAATPQGGVWVAWTDTDAKGRRRVFARRSNAKATRLGAVVSIPALKGADALWKLDASAQAGRLDVLLAAETPGSLRTYHAQLRPGLTLAVRPGRVVRFRVTDAGDPVAGATVRLAGRRATTNAAGRARIALGHAKRRTRTATAAKAGWVSARATVRLAR